MLTVKAHWIRICSHIVLSSLLALSALLSSCDQSSSDVPLQKRLTSGSTKTWKLSSITITGQSSTILLLSCIEDDRFSYNVNGDLTWDNSRTEYDSTDIFSPFNQSCVTAPQILRKLTWKIHSDEIHHIDEQGNTIVYKIVLLTENSLILDRCNATTILQRESYTTD